MDQGKYQSKTHAVKGQPIRNKAWLCRCHASMENSSFFEPGPDGSERLLENDAFFRLQNSS